MLYILRVVHRDEMLQAENGKSGPYLVCITTKDPRKAKTWTDRAQAESDWYELRERGLDTEVMPLEEFVRGSDAT